MININGKRSRLYDRRSILNYKRYKRMKMDERNIDKKPYSETIIGINSDVVSVSSSSSNIREYYDCSWYYSSNNRFRLIIFLSTVSLGAGLVQ